nr:chromosomal replication initiator DnaA [Szabonella alba]
MAFDLPHRTARGREDFFVSGANAAALAGLDGWRDWPEGRMLLIGPEGAGKTHLAHVWADASGARIIAAASLPGQDLPALAEGRALVVEDADRIGGASAAEDALFHLYNIAAAGRVALLITARGPVPGWGLRLPDLQSRMQSMAQLALQPPDDALLAAVLVKLFADRQLAVPASLIPYLLARMERSLAGARALVAALDHGALAAGGAITQKLAKRVLGGE